MVWRPKKKILESMNKLSNTKSSDDQELILPMSLEQTFMEEEEALNMENQEAPMNQETNSQNENGNVEVRQDESLPVGDPLITMKDLDAKEILEIKISSGVMIFETLKLIF